ncbi:MAG: LIC_10091 family protein [Gemmatimonadaceae bacterium]
MRLLAFLVPLALSSSTLAAQAAPARVADSAFAALVAELSEPGGYFDSDNLISNETSYLHVVTRLRQLKVRGGAYLGVGPDQNYSYISAIRPAMAYMIDIRRDNALQHLLFKALFARSRNRVEYLCRWLGSRVPADVGQWTARPILELLAWVDSTRLDSLTAARERRETLRVATSFGVPLSTSDRETMQRFHADFMRDGLELRFSSFRRFNTGMYPTLRRLILERDLGGDMRSYLVRDEDWRYVKDMHAAGRIVPVVGNLAGTSALAAIGRDVRARGLRISALYTSNAEMYVWRDGGFDSFATTVTQLPVDPGGVIIRSYFDRSGTSHPLGVAGHISVQLLQRFPDFLRQYRAGAFRTYLDVVMLDAR